MHEWVGIVLSKEKTITFELVTTMGFIQKHLEQKRFGVNASKNPSVRGNAYTYDQLNRLSSSRTFTNLNYTTNQWQFNSITNPQAYATNYTYDAMGNILTQKRNGNGVTGYLDLDDLTYNYHTNGDGLISNRLYSVNDAVSSGNYADDIDDQGTFDNTHSTIETANNYGYDELGNLVRDDAEEIEEIVWNTYGKIKEVKRISTSDKPDLEFLYDASGQRLAKIVKPKPIASVAQPQVVTWYVRDAQGNVMAVYSYKMALAVDEEAVECEDVVDFLVTEHGAETFANFTTQEIGAHNWTNGPDEIESAIITASKQMDVLYELEPSILLSSDYTLFTNVYSSFDQATLANLVVTDIGATSVSSSICTNTWIDHLYASNPNDYLTELNGINVLWMRNLYNNLFPQPPNPPYPGFMSALGMIMGQPDATVSSAIISLGGCTWNNLVASALETSNSGTLESAMTGYGDFKQRLETVYGTTYLNSIMDDYSRTGLWDAIIATTLYTAEDILAYYKTNDPENFVNISVKNHPEGFCDMAAEEGFDFMEHKTEIKNFYGNQTYKNLMEHLKTLHSTEVQAFVLDELHIYGSSRLGVLKMDYTLVEFDEEEIIAFEAEASTEYMHRDLGQKRYELSNHLGNVLVTVTDKKIYVEDTGTVDHFLPEIMSISDYYPFGSPIASRAYASGEYRYGFNGMEKDGENTSGAYDFGARVLDTRLGRWMAVDPFFKEYPFISTYNFALNSVLQFVDSDGERVYFVIVSGIDADIQSAAKTRENEILNSSGFDKDKDHVYVIQISDLGKLKEEVAKNVKDAKEKGYGLTVEASFFSHAGGDGPQGTEETSKNSLKSVTESNLDRKQLSPTGWKEINFNFDPKESVAAFYGCNTDAFAQKFLNYSNVKYTAGVDGSAGGSKTFKGKFQSTLLNYFRDNPYKVYLVSTSNPCDMDENAKCEDLVNPRNVYSRDSKNATYNNKGKQEEIKIIDAEGSSHTLKKPSEIKGNVTVDRETKKAKSGS